MDWFCRILKSMKVKEMPTILLAGGAGYIDLKVMYVIVKKTIANTSLVT